MRRPFDLGLMLGGIVGLICSVCAPHHEPTTLSTSANPGPTSGAAAGPYHGGAQSGPRASAQNWTPEAAVIDRLISKYRSRIPDLMASSGLPALALALVGREGPLWVEGFGTLGNNQRTPVDANTLFSLQSSSKTVTATALLAAVRHGLVDLDTPITEYLPAFTVRSRFEEHPQQRMTLRHLLGHRAGFTHEAPVGNNYVPAYPSFKAHIDSIQRTWLRYPVGLHQAYANLGVDLAGYILGVVSGQGFPAYIQRVVLEPLGMTHSSYDWNTIRQAANRARGHWKLVKKMPLEFAMVPSGGLYSSARDMAAFLQFQLNDGRVHGHVLIDEALLQEMRNPSFALPGQDLGYGLGLRRYQWYNRPYYEHAGGGFGFKSHLSWYPDLGVGIVVLSNSMDQNVVHSVAREIIDDLNKASGLKTSPPRPYAGLKPPALPQSATRPLLGIYRGRGSRRIDVSLDGNDINLQLEGETLSLQMISSSEGFVEWEGGKRELIRFVLEKSGKPLYLVRVRYGWHYNFDHGPGGPTPGPDKTSWDAYLGTYEIDLAGSLLEKRILQRENGYLVFGTERLVDEWEPGLFFSVKGEALDLRRTPPSWRNIPLRRLPPEG